MRWTVFQRRPRLLPSSEETPAQQEEKRHRREQMLAETQERWRHSLVGRWSEPMVGGWSPGPVSTWEFYADGTGQTFFESGMGVSGKQFRWREEAPFTLCLLDLLWYDDRTDKHGIVRADDDEDWYPLNYHFALGDDPYLPGPYLYGLEGEEPLEFRGELAATCPPPPV